MKAAGVPLLFHYLDDFLIFGCPGSDKGLQYLWIALQVLEDLKIPVAWPKLEGPSTLVTFLGILIDTIRLELRLPPPYAGQATFSTLCVVQEAFRQSCGL